MSEADITMWSEAHPIGTRVLAYPGGRDFPPRYTKIRSAAWLLPSGHAVVLVEQKAGGIALTHIEPATEQPEQHDTMMRLQLGDDIVRASRAKLEEMVKRHLATLKGTDFNDVVHALTQGATEQELTEMVFTVLLGEFGENLFADAAAAYQGIEDLVNMRKGGQANG